MRSTRSAARVLTLAGLLAGTALLLPAGLRAQALLRPGTEARGELKSGDLRLDDNTYADLWRFSGTSGQRVRIIMRSDAFDAYLSMGWIDDSGEFHLVESDDDGAGGTNPQVTAVLPRSGEFVARANTLSEGETGAYTLLLETDVTGDAPVAAGGGGADRPRVVGAITVGTPVSGELKQGDEVLDQVRPHQPRGARDEQLHARASSSVSVAGSGGAKVTPWSRHPRRQPHKSSAAAAPRRAVMSGRSHPGMAKPSTCSRSSCGCR